MTPDRPISFHLEAFAELEQVKSWYNEQSDGLGETFCREIQYAITHIQASPDTWPEYSQSTRRFRVHWFPFAIVYWPTPSLIQILAITNLKRKPGYWKSRHL